MNKVEIKKAVGLVQRELTKYGLMTPGKGIDFKVSIMVEQMENDRMDKESLTDALIRLVKLGLLV